MSDPRFLLSQLRQQLSELADDVAPYADLPGPTRFDRGERRDAHGPVWDVDTGPGVPLMVRGLDQECDVFIEGAAFSFAGDWHALSSRSARNFALALLAAADWSDTHHKQAGESVS